MKSKSPEKGKNKIIGRVILIAILVAGCIIGYIKYREAQKYETTDDAQIESDITPVAARIPGYVAEIRFTDDQAVHKGDTLLLIDSRELQIKAAQAESALQNAEASLDVARANESVAEQGVASFHSRIDELKIRLASAERELSRYENLRANNAGTAQQLDKARTERDAAKSESEMAEAQLTEAQKKTGATQEQAKVAESVIALRKSDLDYAKLQLSYTVITAPADGIVSKKNIETGQYIQPSQPLCAIVLSNHVWVGANFKETQLNKMKEGQEAEVEADAFKGSIIKGKIASFSSATGSTFSLIPPDNASGNYVKVVQRVPVKIELDNTNELYKKLKPGMSLFVKVVTGD